MLGLCFHPVRNKTRCARCRPDGLYFILSAFRCGVGDEMKLQRAALAGNDLRLLTRRTFLIRPRAISLQCGPTLQLTRYDGRMRSCGSSRLSNPRNKTFGRPRTVMIVEIYWRGIFSTRHPAVLDVRQTGTTQHHSEDRGSDNIMPGKARRSKSADLRIDSYSDATLLADALLLS